MARFTRRWRALVFLVPLSLALGGCPAPEPDVFVYNNSGSNLILQSRYGEIDWWASGVIELERYHLAYERNESGSLSIYIEVQGVDFSARYMIDDAFLNRLPWTDGGVAKLQLESDGKLYLVPPGETPPVADLAEQPQGFPLEPLPSSGTMTPYPDRQSGKRS
ncbi:MAG: hypothetical protein ABJL17_04945 [Parvibaculum sp.]|uniref:hypothetical protein n=1 Tax=Parvibaculum sp. TaxID=2024848 RepID=UPI003266B03E